MPSARRERDDAGADGPGAEHAERLAEELRQQIARPPPPAHLAIERGIRRRDGEHEGEGVLGDREALMPGVLHTVTPWRPAASRSMLSVPVPQIDTILRLRHDGEDALGEARVGADVDGDPRAVDAPDQLGLVVGAAAGMTRISPICLARSCAAVPSKTEGKSSGTEMVTGGAFLLTRRRRLRLGGGHAGAGLALVAEVAQRQLERGQRRQHVERARGDAHGADAQRARPDLVRGRCRSGCRTGRACASRRPAGSTPFGVLMHETVFDQHRGVGEHLEPHRLRRPAHSGCRRRRAGGSGCRRPSSRMSRTATLHGRGEVRRDRDRLAARRAVRAPCRRGRPGSTAPSSAAGRRRAVRRPALRRSIASQARGLTETSARPSGAARHFCEPRHVEVHAPLVGAHVDAGDRRHGVEQEERADRAGDPPRRPPGRSCPWTSRCARA